MTTFLKKSKTFQAFPEKNCILRLSKVFQDFQRNLIAFQDFQRLWSQSTFMQISSVKNVLSNGLLQIKNYQWVKLVFANYTFFLKRRYFIIIFS